MASEADSAETLKKLNELICTIAAAHAGLRDAMWYLAMAIGQQPGISARQLADSFSNIVQLHQSGDEEILMPVLDIVPRCMRSLIKARVNNT